MKKIEFAARFGVSAPLQWALCQEEEVLKPILIIGGSHYAISILEDKIITPLNFETQKRVFRRANAIETEEGVKLVLTENAGEYPMGYGVFYSKEAIEQIYKTKWFEYAKKLENIF